LAVPAVIVAIEELPAMTELGLRETLGPPAGTDAVRLTVADDPEVTVVETIDVVEVFGARETAPGLSEIEKSFVAAPLVVRVTSSNIV
jgi:hypothetical protein